MLLLHYSGVISRTRQLGGQVRRDGGANLRAQVALNPMAAGDVYRLREGRNGRGQTSEGQDGRPAAVGVAGRGSAAACRVGLYSPSPVPDRIPVNPHDWLA